MRMEPLITIAISDLAGPTALSTTLAALARHTLEPHEVVLFVEADSRQTIRSDNQKLQQIIVPAPFGAPAALNRLLAVCATPYALLLESGTIVTSGWLSRLLEPFDDASVGLSGPSTNICWNEQQVLPRTGETHWSIAQIEAYATEVSLSYAGQRRALDTLHSLNDFCYLFKRSVAEQLGGFDEAYGAGPCWEIDFNTRAGRAGFKAIWVADAYVHRAQPTPTQIQTIHRLFTTSKHLYQDRFCGLRLRGEQTSYKSHCRGEDCEHFAPPDLIQVALRHGFRRDISDQPLAHKVGSGNSLDISTGKENSPSKRVEEGVHTTIGSQPTSVARPTSDLPLVSCIMPTRNRRDFVRQALMYFDRQDYPNRELIIVDDGNDRLSDLIPPGSQVNYIALFQKTSIGAKRNIACEQARGTIIAHWDDDDWYASHRLRHQVMPLLDDRADITGLETPCFFDLTRWQVWTCTPDLHRRLFVGDVHGGTLVYWRWVWERLANYPKASLREDASFLEQACLRGARLHKLPHANSFVYLRHSRNAWHFPLGSYLQPAGWERADLNSFLPPTDLTFYATLSPVKPSLTLSSSSASGNDEPLVSCIMPTYNRRSFAKQAISYFLRQDYANKELIIVDDGTDAISDLIPIKERIRYIRLREKTTVGAKRNMACEQAQGTIIAHWDDDDWYAPHRLRYQVEALLREGTDICGTNAPLYYDAENGRAWQYVYPGARQAWVAGGTLCYMRSFWASNRFANVNVGEDTHFVWSARTGRVSSLPDSRFYVGMVHSHNVSPKKTNESYWRPYPLNAIQRLLGTDWDLYHPHQVARRLPDLQRDTLPRTEIDLSVN
jgi:glycosyltransferase involved in cell wall biosynthesis